MFPLLILLASVPGPVVTNRDVQTVRATARIERVAFSNEKTWLELDEKRKREFIETLPTGQPVLLRVRDYE